MNPTDNCYLMAYTFYSNKCDQEMELTIIRPINLNKYLQLNMLQARLMKPSIIFVDECDTLFGKRSEGERSSLLTLKNAFLQEMDGESEISFFIALKFLWSCLSRKQKKTTKEL